MDERKDLPEETATTGVVVALPGSDESLSAFDSLYGTSRIACGIGILSVSFRARRSALRGWSRRMGDDVRMGWRKRIPIAALGDFLSALPGTPLCGLHLLHWFQSEFRRVQGYGLSALRTSTVCSGNLRRPAGPQARRDIPAKHRLFRLLHRYEDDERKVRHALRWSTAQTRKPAHSAGNGSGPLGAGRYRRGHAAACAHSTSGNRSQ